jgi:putative membrane protein
MLRQPEGASGAGFDARHLDMQAEAQMEAITLFRTHAGSGEDQALVGFARDLATHPGRVRRLIAPQ